MSEPLIAAVTRALVVDAIRAELERQMGSRDLGNLTLDGTLNLEALANAILAALAGKETTEEPPR